MSTYTWLRNVFSSRHKPMKVGIRSFAHLRKALGESPVTIETPEGTTVAELIDLLVDEYGDAARHAIWGKTVLRQADPGSKIVAPLLNGKVIPSETKLRDGMTIVFMPIMAGA